MARHRQSLEIDNLLKESGIIVDENGSTFGFEEPKEPDPKDDKSNNQNPDDSGPDTSKEPPLKEDEHKSNDEPSNSDNVKTEEDTTKANVAPPENNEQKHNWEKREHDAKQAQRLLSAERNRLEAERKSFDMLRSDLTAKRDELDKLIEEVKTSRQSTSTLKKAEPELETEEEDPTLKQIREEYPELARFINNSVEKSSKALSKSVLEKSEQLDKVLADLKKKEAKASEDEGRKNTEDMFAEILDSHSDAFVVGESEEFHNWLNTMPPIFTDITKNTVKYSAKDAIHVLDTYKKMTGTKTLPPRPSEGDVDVPTRKNTSRERGKVEPNSADDTFTDDEMANIHLLANRFRSKAEREFFDKKLERTLMR